MSWKWKLTACIAAAALLCCSCSAQVQPSGSQSSEPVVCREIAVVVPEGEPRVLSGFEAGTREFSDVRLTAFTCTDTASERAVLKQIAAGGYDALAIWPIAQEESLALLKRLSEDGLPVATAGESGGADFVEAGYYYGDYALGAQLGEYALQYITEVRGGKAQLGVFAHSDALGGGTQQVNGFLDQLDELEGISAVEMEEAGDDEELADAAAALAKSKADVLLCTGPDLASRLCSALAEAGKSDVAVFCIGTDADTRALLEAEQPLLKAALGCDRYVLGQNAMRTLIERLYGTLPYCWTAGCTPITEQVGELLKAGDAETIRTYFAR